MKKVLTPTEFKKFIAEIKPEEYIFSTENNQKWSGADAVVKVKLAFKTMIVDISPNFICFKNDKDFLRINAVKEIVVNLKPCILGAVFTIMCNRNTGMIGDGRYTIIARCTEHTP